MFSRLARIVEVWSRSSVPMRSVISAKDRSLIELWARAGGLVSILAGAAALCVSLGLWSWISPLFVGSSGANLATFLTGIALLASTFERSSSRRIAAGTASVVLAVGVAGFISALATRTSSERPWFSLTGALAFTLLAVALLTLDGRSRAVRLVLAGATGTAAALAWLSLVLVLYVPGWGRLRFPAMSDFAAAFVLVLSFGLLGLAVRRFWPDVIHAPGPGPMLLRILVPLVVLVPTLLGWLNVRFTERAVELHDLGLAVVVVANGLLLVALVVTGTRTFAKVASERESARRRFEIFFNKSLVLQCIAGLDGYFKQINPAWEDVLGYTREELLSKPFLDFVHPDDRDATVEATKGLGEGRDVVEFENRYLSVDGRVCWLRWSAASSVAERLIYAAALDVTIEKGFASRLEDANRRLASTNRELEAFAYSVSHDLRAPVRAIDGFARMIQDDYTDRLDGEGNRFLSVIRGEASRMARLIDDLLAFSRLSRREIGMVPVDLSLSAAAIFENFRRSIPERSMEFRALEAPPAHGDRSMLEVVLTNLLSNAVKFTAPRSPSRIEFGGRREESENVYWVRDNGVGFDMAYADKLFRVFQRLHRTEEFEGTGVGLAIVERVITRHGGRVWARSAPGEGAEFRFSLPRPEGATHE